MAKVPNSIEFCGIRLVRFGYRPRAAVKVYVGSTTLVLLKNGNVACSSDKPFEYEKRGYYRSPLDRGYVSKSLVDDLLKLGAVTKQDHKTHVALAYLRERTRKQRRAAEQIMIDAETLNIALPKKFQTALTKAGAL